MPRTILAALGVLLLALSACGGNDSPTAPGSSSPPPAASSYALNGIVTSGGIGVAGASIRIMDSVNVGQARTTDGAGNYSFPSLTPSIFTLQATADNHTPQNKSVNLSAASQTVSFALVKINPIFVIAGTGDSVFNMPTYVSRVRIQGSTNTSCQNFVVYIQGRLIVNVIIGTCSVADSRTHDGTYLTTGGVTEIKISSGVNWAFTEIR